MPGAVAAPSIRSPQAGRGQHPHDGDRRSRLRRSCRTACPGPDSAERIRKFYDEIAIPAESFARAVALAINQPEDVDVNEIMFGPTRQEL
jgi:hypothetical protein